MTKKKKIFYSIISLLLMSLVLLVLRILFCPERKKVEFRKVTIPGEILEAISNQLEDKLLDIQVLSEKLKNTMDSRSLTNYEREAKILAEKTQNFSIEEPMNTF